MAEKYREKSLNFPSKYLNSFHIKPFLPPIDVVKISQKKVYKISQKKVYKNKNKAYISFHSFSDIK